MALEAMTMFYVNCDTCSIECREKKQLVVRSNGRVLKEYITGLGWIITQKKQRILCPECYKKEVESNEASKDLPVS